jgi:hypothetical protein
MKRLSLICSFLLFATAIVQHARALEIAVGEARIKVAAPNGYCPLDRKHPLDIHVITATQQAIQPRNEELAMFVACDRLKAWRDGKTDDLGDTADYQVQVKMKTQNFSAQEMIPTTCKILRKQGAAIVKGTEGQIAENFKSIEALAGKIQLNSQEMYGVLHEDKTGCYAGLLQKLELNDKPETVFVVMTITVVKGKVLYFYHGSSLTGPSTIARLLSTSRSTIAATLAQN